jgi:phosphatidylglycerol:prolipoprotein diacylglycerol transferase
MSLFHPAYLLFVGTGLLIALAFPVTRHIREQRLRRQYWLLQSITFFGAILGAKLSVLVGDYHWPWTAVNEWWDVFWSGRSITGALIFGFLFAELAKPIMGYSMPPNDRFATLLPFTIAIGRVGCLISGCCRGVPYDGWCAIRGADGVWRHPAPLYEIAFQLVVGMVFVLLLRRRLLFGRLFSVYLIVYGLFRFLTEFVRETPKFFGGLSGYQLLSFVMVTLGAAFFLKRTISPPVAWDEFRSTANEETPRTALEASHV